MTVFEVVKNHTGIDAGPATRLDSLGLDSLEQLELFHELNIPNSKSADFEMVGEIAAYLESRAAV